LRTLLPRISRRRSLLLRGLSPRPWLRGKCLM
jgi:hypothetical protein